MCRKKGCIYKKFTTFTKCSRHFQIYAIFALYDNTILRNQTLPYVIFSLSLS